MAKKYTRVSKPLKSLSNDELFGLFNGESNAQIIRTIVMNEKEFLSVDHHRSLRGFWYNIVKPVLSRGGVLGRIAQDRNGDKYDEKGRPILIEWDSELSRNLADLVKNGVLTYNDLMIIDTSRQRAAGDAQNRVISLETYGFKVSSGSNPEIILCIEKDTTFGLLRQVANILGCSWISGRGQNALSATEDLLRQIPEDNRANVVFLSFTDYDKSGYDIAETFANQAEPYQDTLGIVTIRAERLGIRPDQLTPEEVESNKFIPKGSESDRQKWLDMSGGINGEYYGLELDAFEEEPGRLRKILVDGIRKYIIEEDELTSFISSSYIRQKALHTIKPNIDAMIDKIIRRYADKITVKDFDIYDLAVRGFSSLPIQDLCENDFDGKIEKAALAPFISK